MPPSIAGAGPTYIGVMGGVARPGTYLETERSPLLVDVVRHAGGLVDGATGNVRVVRNGRAGQQTFYTPSLDYRLQPGDLLVVDTYPAHQSRQRVDEPDREADLAEADEPVQLAFLNVVARPIVLKMRPENATLAQITRFLKQTPEAAESIRVVETGPRYTRGERDVHTRLVNGSVVFFDASRIDVAELPTLPPAIGETPLAQARSGERSYVDSRSPADAGNEPSVATLQQPRPLAPLAVSESTSNGGRESRDVHAAPTTPSRSNGVPAMNASLSRNLLGSPTNPFAPRNPATLQRTAEIPRTEPTPADSPMPADGPMFGPGPSLEPTDAPAIGTGPTHSKPSSALEPSREAFLHDGPTIVANLPPEIDRAEDANTVAAADVDGGTTTETTANSGAAAPVSNAASSADTGSLAIVVGVLATAGILIWLLSRRPTGPLAQDSIAATVAEQPTADEVPAGTTRRFRLDAAREEPARAAHVAGLGRSTLDELIEGEVTFQEEPVNLPASMQLFGKATGERRFRIDATDEPQRKGPRRPHFIDTPTRATETVAARVPPAETDDESNPTVADSPSRVRMLDRVLTVVHGANRS